MYYTKSNHLKHLSKEDLAVLMELCTYSNNLYNFGLYQVRQYYFQEKKYLTYFSNLKICKENENYKLIQASISTRILQKVDIAMKSCMTLRRSNFQKDIMKKTARYIINYCIEHNIGTVVCGSVSESHEPEKPFISIAFTTLSHTLEYLCEKYSMQFVSQDESYSSQASFLDDDELPDYDPDHPYEGSFSGKRLHRGLYQSKDGSLINADLNGAANILRKCPLGFDL